MALYLFNPPTVQEGPAGFGYLFWRYRINRANTVLVYGQTTVSIRTPGVQDTQEADYCYLGGHEYTITQVERDILVANGYGDNITTI
jgi:hypothetical protein